MNIYLRELKDNLKSFLIWSGIVVLFVIMAVTKFSAFAKDPELLSILDSMPPALMDAFQMNSFNLTTVSGYLGVMFSYYALLAAIFAAMLGSDIISKEERDKTVEFALVLPISRQQLLTGKILAAITNCIAFILVIWGVTAAAIQTYQPDSDTYKFMMLIMVALAFIELVFLAVGVLLGAAMKQYKRATGVAVSILLATYIISIISDLSEDFESLRYITPFKFFNPLMLLNESKFEPLYIWVSLGVIIISLAAAYLTYSKRDLYI